MVRLIFRRLLPAVFLSALVLAQSVDDKRNSTSAPQAGLTALADAMRLYAKGDWDGALQKYQTVLQQRPNSPDAYAGIARVYLKQKKVDLASETVSKALGANDSATLHVVQGEIYFRQGRIAEAEKEWVNVVNSGGAYARAYLGLARVQDAISLRRSGKQMIDKAHDLDPNDPEITRFWAATLGIAQRIQRLQEMVASGAEMDDEQRQRLKNYVAYLLARQQMPSKRCHLVSRSTSTETELKRLFNDPHHIRGYGLNVELNGRQSTLLVDTGASGILVDRGVAEKAGIDRLSDTRIGGIGDKGSTAGWVGMANSIKVGNLEFHDCPVAVIDKHSVVGEDGLIGSDVFEDFLVELDFPREKLMLSPLPQRPQSAPASLNLQTESADPDAPNDEPHNDQEGVTSAQGPMDAYIAPEMKGYTRIFRFGHALLIPTKVGEVPSKLFLLDTGAFMSNITPSAAREVTKVHGDSHMSIKGINGRVENVYSADKAVLQFGHLKQVNQNVVSFDMDSLSDGAGTEISGILGFSLLSLLDIKIDYRDGLVNFDYKAP